MASGDVVCIVTEEWYFFRTQGITDLGVERITRTILSAVYEAMTGCFFRITASQQQWV